MEHTFRIFCDDIVLRVLEYVEMTPGYINELLGRLKWASKSEIFIHDVLRIVMRQATRLSPNLITSLRNSIMPVIPTVASHAKSIMMAPHRSRSLRMTFNAPAIENAHSISYDMALLLLDVEIVRMYKDNVTACPPERRDELLSLEECSDMPGTDDNSDFQTHASIPSDVVSKFTRGASRAVEKFSFLLQAFKNIYMYGEGAATMLVLEEKWLPPTYSFLVYSDDNGSDWHLPITGLGYYNFVTNEDGSILLKSVQMRGETADIMLTLIDCPYTLAPFDQMTFREVFFPVQPINAYDIYLNIELESQGPNVRSYFTYDALKCLMAGVTYVRGGASSGEVSRLVENGFEIRH
jgi:hypothetical protein